MFDYFHLMNRIFFLFYLRGIIVFLNSIFCFICDKERRSRKLLFSIFFIYFCLREIEIGYRCSLCSSLELQLQMRSCFYHFIFSFKTWMLVYSKCSKIALWKWEQFFRLVILFGLKSHTYVLLCKFYNLIKLKGNGSFYRKYFFFLICKLVLKFLKTLSVFSFF